MCWNKGLIKGPALQLCLCLHELTASSILLDHNLMPQLSAVFPRHTSRFLQPPEQGAAVVQALGLIMLQLLTGRYHSPNRLAALARLEPSVTSAFGVVLMSLLVQS